MRYLSLQINIYVRRFSEIMKIAETATDIRKLLAPHRAKSRIALVPTMGCLHEGHLSLIRKARDMADIAVVSIYVNPMQFGPNEDLDAYPRTFDADAAACEAEGVDYIFHPENLYPEDGPKITLAVAELADCLCGKSRPGHFDGVATVVNILFNIIQPDVAVFGEKDWQQLAIIRRMTADLNIPVEVIGAPTVRENDGLAMSSRNRFIDNDKRFISKELQASLQAICNTYKSGETQVSSLVASGRDWLEKHSIKPEYLEIREATNLTLIDQLDGTDARAFVAAKVGNARLIDNIALETL